jgi:signal-transduction protein with cAMP-binding, CBS, and nucleotidyltransferase domain
MMIEADSEVLRLEKRQRGLQRVATAINDLTIYGIYPTNFPKLVKAAEHFKDHVKAEISATKKRIIELGGEDIEEVFTDPLKSEAQKEQDKVNDMYTTKGI